MAAGYTGTLCIVTLIKEYSLLPTLLYTFFGGWVAGEGGTEQ